MEAFHGRSIPRAWSQQQVVWVKTVLTNALTLVVLATAVFPRVIAEGPEIHQATPEYFHQNLSSRGDAPGPGRQCAPSHLWGKEIDSASYEIGCDEIKVLLEGNLTYAGKGYVREVYLAQYQERTVAIKKLLPTPRLYHPENLAWVEMAVMDMVRGRPHVVDMLGFCDSTVVTEAYFSDLEQFLKDSKRALSTADTLRMALDAIYGLQAMHEADVTPIVHNDVSASQLMVDQHGRLRLGDFNQAYFMGTYPDGTPCPFQRKWGHHKGIYTEKRDIRKMGKVFGAIIAGGEDKFPVDHGAVPHYEPTWPRGYVEVIQNMLEKEPEKRPTAQEVATHLELMLEELGV